MGNPDRPEELTETAWVHTAFVQSRLVQAAVGMQMGNGLCFDKKALDIEIASLGVLADLGPYEMQIKNEKQGLFKIIETSDQLRSGTPRAVASQRKDHEDDRGRSQCQTA